MEVQARICRALTIAFEASPPGIHWLRAIGAKYLSDTYAGAGLLPESGYVVIQAHYLWSEIDRHFMFEDMQSEHLTGVEQAQEGYEARLRMLVEKGFAHSDMEF